MLKPIQASVRAIPSNGVSGNIPVYREDRDRRIGNASYDPATNTIDIDITDLEVMARLKKDILTAFSLGSIMIDQKPNG